MRKGILLGTSLAGVLLLSSAFAAEGLTSGPKPGAKVPAFHPLNINGANAGTKTCQVWLNGNKPVVMIFAREINDNLTSLVKKVDAVNGKHGSKMGSFVVFLSDDEKLEGKLKSLAKSEKINKTVLTIDNPAGPRGLGVSKEADVVVVLYVRKTVKANHAFKKGELKSTDVDTIVADVDKLLK